MRMRRLTSSPSPAPREPQYMPARSPAPAARAPYRTPSYRDRLDEASDSAST